MSQPDQRDQKIEQLSAQALAADKRAFQLEQELARERHNADGAIKALKRQVHDLRGEVHGQLMLREAAEARLITLADGSTPPVSLTPEQRATARAARPCIGDRPPADLPQLYREACRDLAECRSEADKAFGCHQTLLSEAHQQVERLRAELEALKGRAYDDEREEQWLEATDCESPGDAERVLTRLKADLAYGRKTCEATLVERDQLSVELQAALDRINDLNDERLAYVDMARDL